MRPSLTGRSEEIIYLVGQITESTSRARIEERVKMAKYKNIQELAEAFRCGLLKDWVLMVDNDSTHLDWRGGNPCILGSDEYENFDDDKYEGGKLLWDSPEVYILDQALTAAGIPNEGV